MGSNSNGTQGEVRVELGGGGGGRTSSEFRFDWGGGGNSKIGSGEKPKSERADGSGGYKEAGDKKIGNAASTEKAPASISREVTRSFEKGITAEASLEGVVGIGAELRAGYYPGGHLRASGGILRFLRLPSATVRIEYGTDRVTTWRGALPGGSLSSLQNLPCRIRAETNLLIYHLSSEVGWDPQTGDVVLTEREAFGLHLGLGTTKILGLGASAEATCDAGSRLKGSIEYDLNDVLPADTPFVLP